MRGAASDGTETLKLENSNAVEINKNSAAAQCVGEILRKLRK